jgi:hypothetical protein
MRNLSMSDVRPFCVRGYRGLLEDLPCFDREIFDRPFRFKIDRQVSACQGFTIPLTNVAQGNAKYLAQAQQRPELITKKSFVTPTPMLSSP